MASERVGFYNPEGKGLRVMFAGNSITHHSPAPAIGLFEHKGVAAHPGDKGIAEIARRIMEAF